MRIEIRKIQQSLGITSVYVTHDQEEAMSLSDWVAVMNSGRIEQMGTPTQVYARPATRFVADFMGKKTSFLPGAAIGTDGDEIMVSVFDDVLPFKAVPDILPGQRVELVVRPENVDVVAPRSGGLPGRVVHAAYLGSQITYEIAVCGLTVTAEVPNPEEREIFTRGSHVGVVLRTRSIHLLPQ